MKARSAFTLIELLVVIAIIAILAVVVVLTLNPAQLLAQSRDANRVSDLATINSAINLYSTDQSGSAGFSLGIASTTYLSVPSSATNCSTLGVASSSFAYYCSSSSNYRLASSTGWIPVNFNLISSGAPFGSIPVDPTNQTSSNLYYTYTTNGSIYDVSAFPESQKYAKTALNEGGNDPILLEAGSGMATLSDAGRGLIGYWPLDEGSGTATADLSGMGMRGTLNNGPAWISGQVGSSALTFNSGSNTDVYIGSVGSYALNSFTLSLWANSVTGTVAFSDGYLVAACSGTNEGWALESNAFFSCTSSAAGSLSFTKPAAGAWHYFAVTYQNSTVTVYIDGVQAASGSDANLAYTATPTISIGGQWNCGCNGVSGSIDDVRLYDRALSLPEIQEIYNAEK